MRKKHVTHFIQSLFSQENKKEEEEIIVDEPVVIPSVTRIMKLNSNEWPYIVVGIIFAAIAGIMPVAFAIILAEILQVSTIE